MKYPLTPIHCRPWQLNAFSLKLIESHYENNYGGALRRLNAITEKLASLDFDNTPGYLINSLKREELVALNSTLLHEPRRRRQAHRADHGSARPRLRFF